MAFNTSDIGNLDAAQAAGFEVLSISEPRFSGHLMRITVPLSSYSLNEAEPALILSDAIRSAAMSHNDSFHTTVWIEAKNLAVLRLIEAALNRLSAGAISVVVTQSAKSSAQADSGLPITLLSAVERVMCGGKVWCPIQMREVAA